MTEQRHGLNYGLIGGLLDLAGALLLGSFLFFASDLAGDAAPRPLVIGVLFATPGVIGLIGVASEQPWLLMAGALPLFFGAGLSNSGATLVFLAPAGLLLLGMVRMLERPEPQRITFANTVGAIAITLLVVFAGWISLIGMTASVCQPVSGGQACGSGYISTAGVLIGAGCLVLAVAIAAIGAANWRRRQNVS
jgi:hypothetical protein